MTKQIGDLRGMPDPDVYRREDGDIYLKLNENFHVPVRLGKDDNGESVWEGAGIAEEFDPEEEVSVID